MCGLAVFVGVAPVAVFAFTAGLGALAGRMSQGVISPCVFPLWSWLACVAGVLVFVVVFFSLLCYSLACNPSPLVFVVPFGSLSLVLFACG